MGQPPLPQYGHYPKEGVFLLGFLPQTLNIVFIMSTLTFHTISTFLSQILPRTAQTGLRNPLEPWSRAARKWKENEEMGRERGNGERFTLYISSFYIYFLPLYPFPISKNVTFCGKMLYMALLS